LTPRHRGEPHWNEEGAGVASIEVGTEPVALRAPFFGDTAMPLLLWQASYTPSGAKGLLKEGGTKRRDAVRQMVEKAGGKLHSFHYAFGDSDLYAVAEFPDKETAVAVSLAVNSAGLATIKSTVLITPEEVDAATKKAVAYRPPGA
jgi:uncharacterized protein with GYD domain